MNYSVNTTRVREGEDREFALNCSVNTTRAREVEDRARKPLTVRHMFMF